MDLEHFKELVNRGFSASQICDEIGFFSLQELFDEVENLKNDGIYYFPYYGNNGEIYYSKNKVNYDDPIRLDPIVTPKSTKFSFIAMGDEHTGSIYSDIRRYDVLKDKIIEDDIHYIFNTGDGVDGPARDARDSSKRLYNGEDQIKEYIVYYPLMNGLITINSSGNHDLETENFAGVSFIKILRSKRHDIKVYSSGCGVIKIADFTILLCHDVSDSRIKERIRNDEDMMVLSSHTHESKTKTYFNGKNICIRHQLPAFSKIAERYGYASGFNKYDIYFENGKATAIHWINYIFDSNNRLINTSENHDNLTIGSDFCRKRK